MGDLPNGQRAAYKSLDDFGPLAQTRPDVATQTMKVPAALLCYWMGAMELDAPE